MPIGRKFAAARAKAGCGDGYRRDRNRGYGNWDDDWDRNDNKNNKDKNHQDKNHKDKNHKDKNHPDNKNHKDKNNAAKKG